MHLASTSAEFPIAGVLALEAESLDVLEARAVALAHLRAEFAGLPPALMAVCTLGPLTAVDRSSKKGWVRSHPSHTPFRQVIVRLYPTTSATMDTARLGEGGLGLQLR